MSQHKDNPDERRGEIIDGATGKPVDTPRRIDLSNLRDVRLEMAHVYRQVDAGQLHSNEGSKRVYMLRQIGDIISIAELEQRVSELETMRGNAGALPYRPEARH